MKIKNIIYGVLFSVFLVAGGASSASADVGDTISISGNIVSSSCNADKWVSGMGTAVQYWSVSNALGDGSPVVYCGSNYGVNTIDISGFRNGVITASYSAGGMGWSNLTAIPGFSTATYTGGTPAPTNAFATGEMSPLTASVAVSGTYSEFVGTFGPILLQILGALIALGLAYWGFNVMKNYMIKHWDD